jgi:hypothetical protein
VYNLHVQRIVIKELIDYIYIVRVDYLGVLCAIVIDSRWVDRIL